MISRNNSNRPHFIRSTTARQKRAVRDERLICLLLRRAINSKVRACFQHLSSYTRSHKQKLTKLDAHLSRNAQICVLLAWKKLRAHAAVQASSLHLLRYISIASRNCQKQVLAHSFSVLNDRNLRAHSSCSKKLFQSRSILLFQALHRLQNKWVSFAYARIRLSAINQQRRRQSLKIISLILARKVERSKLLCWGRLQALPTVKHRDLERQFKEKSKDMEEMRRQLAKKKKECLDLQKQRRANNPSKQVSQSSLRESRSQSRSKKIGSFTGNSPHKRTKSVEKGEKESEADSHDNTSIFSWLNNSFFTYKSGKYSRSINEDEGDCFCKYREKFNHYKCETISLRNQLEIIKNELEVTKDLNQHLQNEMTEVFDNELNQVEIERLRKEIKQLKRDREGMKEKMVKYQKYIANLKVEFKGKIQNLYRSLKKGSG